MNYNFVGPRFFETLGIPLRGRDIRAEDDERAPLVAVISEDLAKRYFAAEDPLGKHIVAGKREFEIVGVATPVKYSSLREAAPPMLYLSYLQDADLVLWTARFAVRVSGSVDATSAALHREVRRTARDLVIAGLTSLEEQIDATLVQERMVATLSSFFGALALLLACVGLYGTLAYGVVRRTREIGVRMALGAERGTVAGMILRQSARPLVIGVALGLPLAFAVSRISQSLLFGISARDPSTYAYASLTLLLAGACAAFLPARRAANVDPIVALRFE